MILNRGMALGLLQAGPAQGDAVIDRYMVADLGRFPDHHTHAVIDKKVPANARARVDLDPGDAAHDLREPAGEQFESALPQAVREPVRPDGMQTRIAKQHLERVARGRVAVQHRLDIFTNNIEHITLSSAIEGCGPCKADFTSNTPLDYAALRSERMNSTLLQALPPDPQTV